MEKSDKLRRHDLEMENQRREYETRINERQNKIDSMEYEMNVHKERVAELKEQNVGIFQNQDRR